jgi:hypothetical protein
MQPVCSSDFYHDGRGPELVHAHWAAHGTMLVAINYYNPDSKHDATGLRHVRFVRPQVVMITPEEVIDYQRLGLSDALGKSRAALWDLGKSEWLQSFVQRHLHRCHHFRLMFYDELIDVVCEEIECVPGGYVPPLRPASHVTD